MSISDHLSLGLLYEYQAGYSSWPSRTMPSRKWTLPQFPC